MATQMSRINDLLGSVANKLSGFMIHLAVHQGDIHETDKCIVIANQIFYFHAARYLFCIDDIEPFAKIAQI